MPMDGFTLSFMERELRDALVGGRVEKVNQPERDALVLLMRGQGGNRRLLLSANANQARAQLTQQGYENPAEPPMFCMLMRKHLQGARLNGLRQVNGDRVLELTFDCIGELGDPVQKTLILEMMGRYSNLTLIDGAGVIIDCIRHVNAEMSRVRQLLPGNVYAQPPAQDKLAPAALTAEALYERLSALTCPLDKALMECASGMAGVCSKEVCAQLGVERGAPCDSLDLRAVAESAARFFATLRERFAPVVLQDATGLAIDFFPFPYRTFDAGSQKPYPTLGEAMDAFYMGRDLRQRMQQRGAGLQRHIKSNIERLEKKKGIMLETLAQSEKAEQNRVFGELLTANMHLLGKGQENVTLTNYYDGAEVTIPLSTQLTPAKNAQSYYKKYRKAKVAEQYAAEQLVGIERDLLVLENALDDLDKCESSVDLSEIRYVLVENGFVRPDASQRKRKAPQEGKPYRFVAEDGTELIVGKNSMQNDRITLHAKGNEVWMHAEGVPGSHVIIRSEQPSDETILYAAKLAVYYSKGRNHPTQRVDYTRRKYVKKSAGAPAGFVTYTNAQSLYVGVTAEEAERIGKLAAENR